VDFALKPWLERKATKKQDSVGTHMGELTFPQAGTLDPVGRNRQKAVNE
jgi:hypothetical protein